MGMNATRAASVRLRAAFDGAVSLGRVQTPTLALVARREEEIRAFRPEPYWLVEARFAARGERLYLGATSAAAGCPRRPRRRRSSRRARPARRDHQARAQGGARAAPAPLRPHDAPAPREHALRVLGPAHACRAQRLYEDQKALTYPRTNSRYLTGDMVAELKPTAELVGRTGSTRRRRRTSPVSSGCRCNGW